MENDLKSAESQFALELIQFGAELASRIRLEASVKSILKPDHSPVTLADMGIQAIAGALLEQYLPEAVLVAEEDADYLRTSEGAEDLEKVTGYVHSFFPHARPDRVCRWIERGRGKPAGSFWTLDPIDGTKGFLRGGQYVTALAFIKDGQVEMSAIGCPELELQGHKTLGKGVGIFAIRGQGCRAFSLDDIEDPKRWVRLQVSPCREITEACILDSFDPEHKNVEKDRRIRGVLGIKQEPIVMDSMAKQVVLASGGAEIFFRTLPRKEPGHREKIWDIAAGALAIEEAGGRVTDLEGRELDFGAGLTLARNPGLVATNGFLHETVLDALREATVS
ncbi:MAG: 3'(2'),5'-bisphosphate nucleotidase [Candidatus Omnitrophica bacterium]|nr:3'(2'),5'-bisphosphate nucleotidase [Candidatus Omnitrophota bacterium]